MAMWVRRGATNIRQVLLAKDSNIGAWAWHFDNTANGDSLRLFHGFSTQFGQWHGDTAFSSTTALNHICLTFDNSSDANDPLMFVNGAAETIAQNTAPSGTATDDAADTLRTGDDSAGFDDLNGDIMCLCYDNRIWDAEQLNRARWWGRPDGAVQVYHPFFTDKLANEGTATANGTASGTTVAAMAAPVVRPGTAMMGMGIGF